jgi:hypothetical protein
VASANRRGKRRELTAGVVIKPVTDEFTGFIVIAGGIGLANRETREVLSGAAQDLSSLVTYSLWFERPSPNASE